MTWGRKMRFFFLRNNNKKKRKKIHREHTCAFCAFSTSVINILRFVECSRSVLSKTSGHLFLSELEFIRMSLISVLEMLEWLQFYFIALAKMLAAPFCLPGQRKKDLHVQWIKEKRPLIFIFVIFTEDYKINAELQEEPGLLMAQITPPESEVFEIHTHVEIVKTAGSKISRLSKPSGNHKTELHLLKKPAHQKWILIKWALWKAWPSFCCPNRIWALQEIWFQLLIPAPPKSASS